MSTVWGSGVGGTTDTFSVDFVSVVCDFGFDSVRTPSALSDDEYCEVKRRDSLLLGRGADGDGSMLKSLSKALFSKLPDSVPSMLFSLEAIGGEGGPKSWPRCDGLLLPFDPSRFWNLTRSALTPSGKEVNLR